HGADCGDDLVKLFGMCQVDELEGFVHRLAFEAWWAFAAACDQGLVVAAPQRCWHGVVALVRGRGMDVEFVACRLDGRLVRLCPRVSLCERSIDGCVADAGRERELLVRELRQYPTIEDVAAVDDCARVGLVPGR